MYEFIQHIYDFILLIHNAIFNSLGVTLQPKYTNWLDKAMFLDNSLIGLNMTYREFIFFAGIWILTIIFVIFIVRFFIKLLSLFRLD